MNTFGSSRPRRAPWGRGSAAAAHLPAWRDAPARSPAPAPPMGAIQLNDPQTLYRRWEDSQWSPFDVDLAADREQWPELDPAIREIIYFALSSLMVAEERITTKFAGLVAAHGSEEEATFLASQQVDEARHMQFYARFRDEVIGSPAIIAAHVESARAQVSPAFRRIFDEALVEAHEALVGAPGDL